jgi:serine/threonine kinase 32
MGPKQSNTTNANKVKIDSDISKNHFDFMYVIGRGGFGKVWKVYSKKYKRAYAMKEMSKARIIDKKSERSIRYEKELLSKYVLCIPGFR